MNYIVSGERLVELLAAELKLAALECGGVDNWSWYGESICMFLDEQEAEDLEELAKRELLNYERGE